MVNYFQYWLAKSLSFPSHSYIGVLAPISKLEVSFILCVHECVRVCRYVCAMGHENGCRTMPSILKDVVVKAVAAMLCIWHQIVYKTERKHCYPMHQNYMETHKNQK